MGGPLTAAFIGGMLVIENLANADTLAAVEGEAADVEGAAVLDRLEGGEASGNASTQVESSSRQAQPVDNAADLAPDDLISPTAEPAPVGNGRAGSAAPASIQVGADGPVDGLPGGTVASGGSAAAINFFNIDTESGAGTDIDPDLLIDDDVLGRNTIVGTPGDDTLTGTSGHDSISGASGNDVLFGLAGSDILNGNDGDDELHGGTGRDRLDGGAGDDLLEGGDDDDLDILRGGSGDDILVVKGINDVALERSGGAADTGDDLLVIESGYADDLPSNVEGSTFVFDGNFGQALPDGANAYRQQVSGGIENLTLKGTADLDIFADGTANRLTGNAGDNLIHAGGGDDIVAGGGGRDRLDGGDGDDVVRGGDGDDVLLGGLGKDELFGEGGNDTFVIGLNDSAIDTVFDHEGANRLVLDGVTDETVEASLLGDDLYVTVDQKPVALVSDYVGHEDTLAGIDFGQGLTSIDQLLTTRPDLGSAVAQAEAEAAEAASNDVLSAHLHLTDPSIVGTSGADRPMIGTDGDDWLAGFGGRDHLYGGEGDDILEGGADIDQLKGGAGNDRYLFSTSDDGSDTIIDHEGRNLAEIKGANPGKVEGAMLGDDLAVLADGNLQFIVKDFAGHEDSFVGVQAGHQFIPTEDLLA